MTFNDEIEPLIDSVTEGATYFITNGLVKPINKKFANANDSVENTLNKDTQIEAANYKIHLDNLQYHFVPFSQIERPSSVHKIVGTQHI